jgi:Nif-specific regulatory protein
MVFDIYRGMEHSGISLKGKIEELEKAEIMKALKECNWIMARAAKTLGITERMIGYKIRKYGIRTREVHWAVDNGQQQKEHGQ